MASEIIRQYGRKVRVSTRPPYHVIVEVWGGADWTEVRAFHTISDDYAWTNAREYAAHLAENMGDKLRIGS